MSATRTMFIVWNAGRNEAVVFDNEADAQTAVDGRPNRQHGFPSSASLADAFFATYGVEEDGLKVETVELPA